MKVIMKRAQRFSTVLLILLALPFAGCDFETTAEKTYTYEAAEEPVITAHPADGEGVIGATVPALTVTASVTDGGSLSYQWYSNTVNSITGGTAESSGTSASFTPAVTGEGVYYYYVVVTNTNGEAKVSTASATSDIATLTVEDPANARYPQITTQPGFVIGSSGTFTVAANAPDGGTLSYQWYSNITDSSTTGTAISGATSASYTASGVTATTWYYVVVTNTNDAAAGRKTSETTSAIRAALITNATVTVDTNTKFQYVRGFGGMHGSWNTAKGQDVSLRDVETMYNPDKGLGYNIFRMMLYPIPAAEWDAKIIGNTEYTNHDNSDWYDIIKKVNGYNGYILASPWTPPKEWKPNGSVNGGANSELMPSHYQDYANYLKNWAKLMSDKGAPVYAVSIQNEPNFPATYDGCDWSPEEMRDFFKAVGHFTDGVPGWGGGQAQTTVKTMNGESANTTEINSAAMRDPDAKRNIDILARHIYGNQQDRYDSNLARNDGAGAPYAAALNYDKEVWMTEHNINSGVASAYPNDSTWGYVWKFMNEVDLSIRLNNESAFIWWYAKRFYSLIGDGDYGTTEHAVLPRGYGLSHYAKFAKETNRVDVSVTGSDASGGALTSANVNAGAWGLDSRDAKITAFESPDHNSISLIMFTPTNISGANGVDVGTIQIQLPAGFIATKAEAMRSTESVKAKKEDVALAADGNSAAVTLPAGNILSVKFTK
ncbi:hypothetical protein AGMMS50267_16040 [Spirochaetia bacterium]|nr:hypothetical protein AGMMS50267_16040 [Spirochaetia bacterium]